MKKGPTNTGKSGNKYGEKYDSSGVGESAKEGGSHPKLRHGPGSVGPNKYPKLGKEMGKGEKMTGGKSAKGTGLGVGPRYFHKAKAASSKMHKANSVGND
jgi:hypothetical protein